MKLSTLAARDCAAQQRIETAAPKIAERFGIACGIQRNPRLRDIRVSAMMQREQTADFLDALIDASPTDTITLAELDALPGVGPATVAKIKQYLAER